MSEHTCPHCYEQFWTRGACDAHAKNCWRAEDASKTDSKVAPVNPAAENAPEGVGNATGPLRGSKAVIYKAPTTESTLPANASDRLIYQLAAHSYVGDGCKCAAVIARAGRPLKMIADTVEGTHIVELVVRALLDAEDESRE